MNDRQLSAEQLDEKYNPDGGGEHPTFTRWDWRQSVAEQSTLRGYWVWVEYKVDKS